jgi:hypothetical protein
MPERGFDMRRTIILGFLVCCLIAIPVVTIALLPETNGSAVARYSPKLDLIRTQFQGISRKLPPAGGPHVVPKIDEMVPAPVFDYNAKEYNTEILMEEQLLDPSKWPDYYLGINGPLIGSLRRASLEPSHVRLGNRDGWAKDFEEALRISYLVVVRLCHERKPTILGTHFTAKDDGGSAEIEVFLFDLPGNDIRCSFMLKANLEPSSFWSLTGLGQPNPDSDEDYEAIVLDSLRRETRRILGRELQRVCGGRFRFDEYNLIVSRKLRIKPPELVR